MALRHVQKVSSGFMFDTQPYITKTIFSTSNPPVNLAKISIGDGALGSIAVFEILPTVRIKQRPQHHILPLTSFLPQVTLIETYPQFINFDVDVYNYFKTQYVSS